LSNDQKKKIKLEKEAISEILVADDSESDAEASDVEDYIEEEGEKKKKNSKP
jgi:hypothetical protein